MKKNNLWVGIIIFIFNVCLTPQLYAEDLTVAIAANLQAPMKELQTAFQTKEAKTIKVVSGSSGKLTAQIENGAPFDIFLSADMSYPATLYKEGLAVEAPKVYATGVLVLWTQKALDLSKGIELLTDPAIKKIAVANPQTAPYGREAINAVKHYQLYPQVSPKFVYGENISQTNDFIVSQAADIGFTAKSTVLTPNLKEKGTWVELDPKSYNPIAQGVVILKHGEKYHPQEAREFYAFLFSDEAKNIFKKYGYIINE